MNKYFSSYLSAYRTRYITQHVLICLLEEWRKNLHNDYFVGTDFIDLPKGFECISHNLIIAKLGSATFIHT